MAEPGSESYVAPDGPPRRVVVRSSGLARRGYVWEIIYDNAKGISVKQKSPRSFRTMEAAYNDGAAALARLPKPTP
jgi:hypothetical protein